MKAMPYINGQKISVIHVDESDAERQTSAGCFLISVRRQAESTKHQYDRAVSIYSALYTPKIC